MIDLNKKTGKSVYKKPIIFRSVTLILIVAVLIICIIATTFAWFARILSVRARNLGIAAETTFGFDFSLYVWYETDIWDEDEETYIWEWILFEPSKRPVNFFGKIIEAFHYDFTAKTNKDNDAMVPNETRRFKIVTSEEMNTVTFMNISSVTALDGKNICDYYYFSHVEDESEPLLSRHTENLNQYKMSALMGNNDFFGYNEIIPVPVTETEIDEEDNETEIIIGYEFIFDVYMDLTVDNSYNLSGFYTFIKPSRED